LEFHPSRKGEFMLKQKTTIVRQWILRLSCVAAMSFLVIWFRGDLPPRAALGQSQEGPPVEITEADPDATRYATFQSHNQKVVANAYGIFMTHIHKQYCRGSNPNPRCDYDDPLCTDRVRCFNAGWDFISNWRLLRSVDGGATFTTIYEGEHGTTPPVLETDSLGNIYLAHANYFQGGLNSYVLRFLASNNFQNPTSTTLTGAWGSKFAMEIDEARGQLYFFSNANRFFHVRLSDLAILAEYQLTQDGTNANMHYPHLYLDDYGHLYVAWTTARINPALEGQGQCGNPNHIYPYRSIHFMRSLDGGVTWTKPNGQMLTPPIAADETGPTDEITPLDERCMSPWLTTFIVKGDKAHFFYSVLPVVNRPHYVRYNLSQPGIDRNVVPFEVDGISLANVDGVCSTRRSIKEIFCVNRSNSSNDSRIIVLKSEDNGLTWRKHALSPDPDPYLGKLTAIYAMGGLPQVTYDGYIIGSYAQSPNFDNLTAPKLVKFFRVASLAEPSRQDVVFTAGDLELTGSGQDFDEFAATAPSPTYVVGQSGLNQIRRYIGYNYADPDGGNKAQFLQFNNLVVGKQYTFYVQPSSIAGDANCFFASAESGAVIFEGGCKWRWPGAPVNRTSDAWKVVFNATAPSATIRLGNYFDASNSGGVSRYLYIDAIYSMIGDLELSGNAQIDTDEFTGHVTAHSPTYVVSQSGLNHVRGYIGYSYGDQSGGNKAQHIQLTNLTVGKNYTLDVYPSGNYGDAHWYYATAISGGTVVTGGTQGWSTLGQFQSIANRWRIVVKAESQTMTLRIGNFWNEESSEGVSRFIYIDAIGLQSN
jgi:hypothetical protein